MCGKNPQATMLQRLILGSPPRVREERSSFSSFSVSGRITPACAGRTNPAKRRIRRNWDHPRVCGKNFIKNQATAHVLGSPPRVREELLHEVKCSVRFRITPACAGRTNKRWSVGNRNEDHPRVCGKNLTFFPLRSKIVGSPPRVREELIVL